MLGSTSVQVISHILDGSVVCSAGSNLLTDA